MTVQACTYCSAKSDEAWYRTAYGPVICAWCGEKRQEDDDSPGAVLTRLRVVERALDRSLERVDAIEATLTASGGELMAAFEERSRELAERMTALALEHRALVKHIIDQGLLPDDAS